MEERKKLEIEYYEKQADKWLKEKRKGWRGDFEGFNPLILSSFSFCYQWLKENCQNKKVLDYGCGNGVHTIPLAKMGAEKVIGIDLSEKSLEVARERAERNGFGGKVEFILMDCEKMEFSDSSFDVIFDSGTFSSIDLKLAYPELARVLKPNGFLLGIETFGHNPLTNLKRKINKITGRRTGWAVEHIFRVEDLEEAKKYFNKIETKFFHLTSWITFPFLGLPGGKFLLKLCEALDKLLFKIPFLRKYAFKVVFIFSQPKKCSQKDY